MNLNQIKAALAAGLTVHWSNPLFTVAEDPTCEGGLAVAYKLGEPDENRATLVAEGDFFVAASCLTWHLDDSGHAVRTDEAKSARRPGWHAVSDFARPARYVGFRAGFELLWVRVVSYLPDTQVDVDEACELAIDLLLEQGWFADESQTTPAIVI
ncbi:hypothetical protein D3C85_794920 [compost metagenome]